MTPPETGTFCKAKASFSRPVLQRLKTLATAFGKTFANAAMQPELPTARPPTQKICLSTEYREALWREHGRQACSFCYGAAGQFHAHDIVMQLCDLGDDIRIQIQAVADGREVVNDDRKRRLLRHLRIESPDHGRRGLFPKIRTWQQQGELRSRVACVGDVFQSLRCGMASDSSDNWVIGRHCLSCDE